MWVLCKRFIVLNDAFVVMTEQLGVRTHFWQTYSFCVVVAGHASKPGLVIDA